MKQLLSNVRFSIRDADGKIVYHGDLYLNRTLNLLVIGKISLETVIFQAEFHLDKFDDLWEMTDLTDEFAEKMKAVGAKTNPLCEHVVFLADSDFF